MKRNGHKLAVLAAALLSTVTYAQSSGTSRAPKWVTKPPVEKNTFSSIVHVPKYADALQQEAGSSQSIFSVVTLKPMDNYTDSAKYKALYNLIPKLPWNIDQEDALLYELGRHNIAVPDIEKRLVSLMYDAPEFVERGTWEGESEYWCYYSITTASFQAFLGRVTNDIMTEVSSLYRQGRAYCEGGYPTKAASSFVRALNAFRPLIFSCIPYEGKDLGRTVLDALLTVYDGITIEPRYDTIPAVCGEALPVDVKVCVRQDGKPLNGVVVYSKFMGESEPASVTDADGFSVMRVTKVTLGDPVQTVTFGIDENAMFDVGTSVADKLFLCRTFPETSVKLKLYDPVVSVNVEMSPYDSCVVKAVSDAVAQSRSDIKLVETPESADITVKISQETGLEDCSVYGKYTINTYSSSLNVDAVSTSEGKVLKHYDIQGYKYRTKGERGQESASHSIARQFVHMLEDAMPEFVGGIVYDKRSIIWQEYQ